LAEHWAEVFSSVEGSEAQGSPNMGLGRKTWRLKKKLEISCGCNGDLFLGLTNKNGDLI
jgi:hypothetical protein